MNDCAKDQLLIRLVGYAMVRADQLKDRAATVSLPELVRSVEDHNRDFADILSALTSARHHEEVIKALAEVSTEDLEAALKQRAKRS